MTAQGSRTGGQRAGAIQQAKATVRRSKDLQDFLRHVERTYGITGDEYMALYRAQGGACYICKRATGKSRRLGVDHDHLTGEVRGLVCTGSLSAMTCNRLIAIYTRAMLLRAVAMLSDPPPARAVLQAMRAEGFTDQTLIPAYADGVRPFTLSEVKRDV